MGGTVVQTDEPSWSALLTLLGDQLAGWFMWTHELRLEDGTRVDAFKHGATRRYIHVAPDLRAFKCCSDGRYIQVELVPAIREAFLGWDRTRPSPSQEDQLAAALTTAEALAG